MAKNGLSIAEVSAFAERIKVALANAEADRRTVETLRAFVVGGIGGRRGRPLGSGGRGHREIHDQKILQFVRGSKSGVGVGEIMKKWGLDRGTVVSSLKRMRDAGSV